MKLSKFKGKQIILKKLEEEQSLVPIPYFKAKVLEAGAESDFNKGETVICDKEGLNTYFKPWRFNDEDVLYARKDDYVIAAVEDEA